MASETAKNVNLRLEDNSIDGIGNPTSGTSVADPSDSWAGTTVYYGNKEYYVLDRNGNLPDSTGNPGTQGHSSLPGSMLLLSKGVIDDNNRNFDDASSNWTGSDIETYLNGDGFYNTLNATEKAAISSTAISNGNTDNGGYTEFTINSTNNMYLLDLNDVRNTNYGFCSLGDTSGTRIANPNCGTDNWWWLRSPGYNDDRAAYVLNGGRVSSNGHGVSSGYGSARPASNLNLSSVLFSSASGASKSSFGLTTDGSETSSWKMTLKDESGTFLYNREDSLTSFNTNDVVRINVTDISSQYEYITAMVLGSDNTVLGYGKIGDASTGIKTFEIPDGVDGGTKIKFFAETWNGGNETDYAREYGRPPAPAPQEDEKTDNNVETKKSEDTFVNPLSWYYEADPYGSLCLMSKQGPVCTTLFQLATPKGFREAFSFNLLLRKNGIFQPTYDKKAGRFVINIPKEWQKAGRTFALIGIDKFGNTKIFTDNDLSDETFTTTLDMEGYAFSLIYMD